MAESVNNIITHGLSGKVGSLLVFSQRHGKTVVAKAPRKTSAPTEKQKLQQERFQEATLYARAVIADPTANAEYASVAAKKPGQSVYNIAVADFLKAPQIDRIDLSGYHGQIGDTIKVRVLDDFDVVSVRVQIVNADGSVVEEGAAVDGGLDWVYTATATNADMTGDKIVIRATDRPDNLSEETKAI